MSLLEPTNFQSTSSGLDLCESISLEAEDLLTSYSKKSLILEIFEKSSQGLFLLNQFSKIIYANRKGIKILLDMGYSELEDDQIPEIIEHIHNSSVGRRNLDSGHQISVLARFCINPSVCFDVQTRWLNISENQSEYLLFIIEEHNQLIKHSIADEAEKYGLTPRETEVWLLYKMHHSYREIASRLGIAINTVKKHMKNIFLKQQHHSKK